MVSLGTPARVEQCLSYPKCLGDLRGWSREPRGFMFPLLPPCEKQVELISLTMSLRPAIPWGHAHAPIPGPSSKSGESIHSHVGVTWVQALMAFSEIPF